MAETGAMWVDGIVPSVPYRQRVLSFFIPSRLLFAPRPERLSAVLGVVTRALSDDVIRRAGQHTMCFRVPTLTESVLPIPGALTANHEGFSLNAAVACGATQWDKLERRCRYLARQPLSTERLASDGDGLVVHERKRPFRDATTHCLFEALVFFDKEVLERSVCSPPGHSYTSLQVPARVRSRMRRAPSWGTSPRVLRRPPRLAFPVHRCAWHWRVPLVALTRRDKHSWRLSGHRRPIRFGVECTRHFSTSLAIPMKFYDLAGSPNTRRVRIYLAEKSLDIETVPVDMQAGENSTPEFLAKNSLGVMPVLELDDGTCISESVAICRYLEELHPDPPLFGRDALERARVEMWNRRMEFQLLLPAMQTFVNSHEMWKGRRPQVPEWADACRQQMRERYVWINESLTGRDFLVGDTYTVADITAQCAVLLAKAVCDVRIADDQANLAVWWERVAARPTARA